MIQHINIKFFSEYISIFNNTIPAINIFQCHISVGKRNQMIKRVLQRISGSLQQ